MAVRAHPTVYVRVVDEDLKAISDAEVSIGYYGPGITANTDTNGMIKYRDKANGILACNVKKTGYYPTRGELWDGPSSAGDTPPTNMYTIILKKITDPVPMIDKERVVAKYFWFEKPVGFDFEIGDWVAPFGKGRIADFIVNGRSRGHSFLDYECYVTISTTNSGDGFMEPPPAPLGTTFLGSELASPASAPATGYQTNINMFARRLPGKSGEGWPPSRLSCVFRVRTQKDETGRIVRSNYGYIYDGFGIGGAVKEPYISLVFGYYFNPNPTSRSLEPETLSRRK
jgi:hypothetical protein